MPATQDLKNVIEDMETLKLISEAYTEISAAKMKKIRAQFEQNASFYQEITHIYQHVLIIAAKRGYTPPPKSGDKERSVSIAVTSNQRFYGRMNLDVLELFEQKTRNDDTDRIVIGKTGREYYRARSNPGIDDFVIFPTDSPTKEDVQKLLDKTEAYDKVFLYYPKFVTVLKQEAAVMETTYTPYQSDVEEFKIDYIFEPELPHILAFFQKQVHEILLMRSMLEVELARTASRLITMSAAEERARELIKQRKTQLRKLEKSIQNIRLLETLSGIKLWKND